MIPFLDHVIQQLTERFDDTHKKIVKLLGLVPQSMCSSGFGRVVPDELNELVEIYQNDLPVPDLFAVEYASWVRYWESKKDKLPDTLQESLKECDPERFRNIFVLLKIALTLPVTTCENERSHSQLKLLKTNLRSTMGADRLSSVMLMKVHRQLAAELPVSDLVDKFERRHPRRMLLNCVLKD